MYRLIAYSDVNEAPKGYYPHIIRHGLYESDTPSVTGKRFFLAIDPRVSKTWITNEEMEKFRRIYTAWK